MALLSLSKVDLRYGGHPLLDGVEFHIERGDRVCLLGINGAGKSSMLRLMAGEVEPDGGRVVCAAGLRIAYLPQQVPTDLQGTALEIACEGPTAAHDPHETELEAHQMLDRLGIDPDAEFSTLSGGARRRVLLARALKGAPDLILLDEPTNHLDLETIAWLESFLLRYGRTFLFITHDRSFLRRLATRVVELDRGRLSDWACDYDTFLQRKEAELDAEAKQWGDLDRRLKQEEAWLRQGVKARRTRNEGRVRALMALREERRRRRERSGTVQMNIQEADRTGQLVVQVENLSFDYGERPLLRDVSVVLSRGDKVGILGPNGCGKTTLLNLLLNEAPHPAWQPKSGRVRHGTNLCVAYSDQLRAQLNETQSLVDNIAQGQEFLTIQGTKRHVMGYLQDFLFTPDRARQPVSVLSGGERNRLLLARLFAQPSNVIVLDEPTNDLDLDTLELLEEQLEQYQGTVLVVSHDRAFLNNVVTSVWAFEKSRPDEPGRGLGPDDGWFVNEYVGGYDDWAARRAAPPPPPPENKPKPPPALPPAVRRKLSSKEKRELEALPGRIESIEREQASLHERMADPSFYKQSVESMTAVRQRSEALDEELKQCFRRWEELESQS